MKMGYISPADTAVDLFIVTYFGILIGGAGALLFGEVLGHWVGFILGFAFALLLWVIFSIYIQNKADKKWAKKERARREWVAKNKTENDKKKLTRWRPLPTKGIKLND